ncbi:hypothetical protein ACLB1R_18705 [Escherichia coli]
MYNDEHKYTACMQAMNEQFKSAFLKLIQQNHEAVKSIQAEPYGHLHTTNSRHYVQNINTSHASTSERRSE